MPWLIRVYNKSDKDIQMCGTVITRSHFLKTIFEFSMMPIPLAIFLLVRR